MNYVDQHMKFRSIEVVGGVALGVGDNMMPWGQDPDVYGWAKRFYVDPTWGDDNRDGRSWRNAFATFEKAIDSARFPYGTTSLDYTNKSLRSFVFLAPGHYNEDTDHASQYLWSGYNISVIGCGTPTPGKDYGVSLNYDGASASTAMFLMSGSGNELYGVHIYCDAAIPALYLYNGDNNTIHYIVIECDGTTCTYGIYAPNMKGSVIEHVKIYRPITAGIYIPGGADCYAINGHIRDAQVFTDTNGAVGIKVAGSGTLVSNKSFHIVECGIGMAGGSSDVGVQVASGGKVLVLDNDISVPSSADPISHAGGDEYVINNHTAAGTTNVDPEPAAG